MAFGYLEKDITYSKAMYKWEWSLTKFVYEWTLLSEPCERFPQLIYRKILPVNEEFPREKWERSNLHEILQPECRLHNKKMQNFRHKIKVKFIVSYKFGFMFLVIKEHHP